MYFRLSIGYGYTGVDEDSRKHPKLTSDQRSPATTIGRFNWVWLS